MRNRDVAALFLTFIEYVYQPSVIFFEVSRNKLYLFLCCSDFDYRVEYYSSNAEVASSWDIKKHNDTGQTGQQIDVGGDISEDERQVEENGEVETMDAQENETGERAKLETAHTTQSQEKPSARLLTRSVCFCKVEFSLFFKSTIK